MATSTRDGGAERRLGGADRGGLRVGVRDARDGLVVGRARLAEDVGGDDAALVLADVGKRPDAGDVADRPQALAGAQVRVDRDAVGVGLDADGLQADPVHPRAPAGGDEQPVAAQLAPVARAPGRSPRRRAARRSRSRRGRSSMPSRAQDLAERLASGAGSRGSRCSERSMSTTSPPRRRTACAISTPTGPPPSTSRRRGTAFMPVASRFVQTPSSSRRPRTAG